MVVATVETANESSEPTRWHTLQEALEAAAHVLPAQGPLGVFIHHNTLHALEDQPFEQAVVEGGRLFGCEPYLSAAQYRTELATGRISDSALRAVVAEELGAGAEGAFLGGSSAAELLERLLRHGIPHATGRTLHWLIEEENASRRLRSDLPPHARARLLNGPTRAISAEETVAAALWHHALTWAEATSFAASAPPAPLRLRDLLLERTRVDVDEMVHPLLIRLSAAFLDQGVAHWAMPTSGQDFHSAIVDIYGSARAWTAEPWLRRFAGLLDEDRCHGRKDAASLIASLESLNVALESWTPFLRQTALALRGWAGMFRQLELRPHQAPVCAVPATLVGFLAVRLLAERAACEQVARDEFDWRQSLGELRTRLLAGRLESAGPSREERAWPLFQLFQLAGTLPEELAVASPEARRVLASFLVEYSELEQRRLLHLAFERSFHAEALSALLAHPVTASPGEPVAQVVCCIDEREESFRRHLEEADPAVETLGYVGFFGVPMSFRAIDEAHGRPLCPVNLVPRHEIAEVPLAVSRRVAWSRLLHRGLARRRRRLTGESATLVRGTLATVAVGALSAIPLALRVLLPVHHDRLRQRTQAVARPRPLTGLALERQPAGTPGDGLLSGFTVEEMAEIVGGVLKEMGVANRLAPLVVLLAHGSTSLNNPHESAHDCGACGGGRGGPTARTFAAMANHPGVRDRLQGQGVAIPAATWFVGGEHNTCDDSVDLFDLDRVPPEARPCLANLEKTIARARARNAHERCRRYESAPSWLPDPLALRHVAARARDLAQPRPEYGHATNALCVIGPRSGTRGLFLDRRAFLASYEPSADPDGCTLARIMGAVIPVVAGISLEYYFSVVDPTGYGCGTKLPHNVSGLLGVMDGHASDLRTGLPWQMVEIHEPMRLLVLVDAPANRVAAAMTGNDSITRLARNRWIRLVARDQETGRLVEWADDGFLPMPVQSAEVPRRSSSRAWYEGKRGHLPFASIAAEEAR